MIRVSVLSALIAGGLLSAAPAPQPFHRPFTFEPNQGQAPVQVKWLGQSSRYQVRLDSESVTIVIPDKSELQVTSPRLPGIQPLHTLKYSAVRMKLAGSQPWKEITGAERTAGVSNYVNPRNLDRSINGVPQYSRVKVANVYEGIDLLLYTNDGDLEYDFAVAAGANPEQIQMDFDGTRGMRLDPKSGDLILTLSDGSELRQLKPKVYQQSGDQRVEIAGAYKLSGRERAAFTLAGYDRSHALVIDPRLTISRSFDGLKDDEAKAIAVDADGNTYITGSTFSENFPVTNNSVFVHPKDCGINFCGGLESDVFLAKVTADGSLEFVTYGGVGFGSGIAVDSSGIYITGMAVQPDSDVNNFPFDNNAGELFVQRLSPTGQGVYFTIAGGPGEGFGIGQDFGNAIALDDQHNAWAVGATYPSSGIVPPGNALIVKIAPDGAKLVQRTYSSTTGDDVAMGVAVANRQPWVTGKTCGDDFVTTDGTTHSPGHCAVFVLHLDEAGNRLMGTIFGGQDGDDAGVAIAMNGSNSVYVIGYANSLTFPSTTGSEILPQGPFTFLNPRGFVTEVDSFGRILRSLLLSAPDGFVQPYAIANDDRGRGVYVAGTTSSRSFPGAEPVDPNASLFGFLAKLSPDLSELRYTVILGQQISAVALRGPTPVFPEIYVAGWENGSFREAFMVKMLDETPASRMSTNTPLPEVSQKNFLLQWSGSSPFLSPVTFDIFVSDNGGPFTPFMTATTTTFATFQGVPGHTYRFFSVAADADGNREPMKTRPEITVKVIDPTPPVISPQIIGTVANNGWYRNTVEVNWGVSDPESGIASSKGCFRTRVTGDTAGLTLTCSASNAVGMSTAVPVTIKLDRTRPVISGMPGSRCSLSPANHKLVKVATVTATDALSGLAAGSLQVTGTSNETSSNPNNPQIVVTPNGSGGFDVQLQADRLGRGHGRIYSLSATAMDNAGNSSTVTATCTVPLHKEAK